MMNGSVVAVTNDLWERLPCECNIDYIKGCPEFLKASLIFLHPELL